MENSERQEQEKEGKTGSGTHREETNQVSRRKVLRLAGLAATGMSVTAAVEACAPQENQAA